MNKASMECALEHMRLMSQCQPAPEPMHAPIMAAELEEQNEGQASPDDFTDDLSWDISRLDIASVRTAQIYTHPESIEPDMEEEGTAQAVAPSPLLPLGNVNALQRYDLPFDVNRMSEKFLCPCSVSCVRGE